MYIFFLTSESQDSIIDVYLKRYKLSARTAMTVQADVQMAASIATGTDKARGLF